MTPIKSQWQTEGVAFPQKGKKLNITSVCVERGSSSNMKIFVPDPMPWLGTGHK